MPPRKKTTPPAKATSPHSASPPSAPPAPSPADQPADTNAAKNAGELERLAAFVANSYPAEARTDETPVDIVIRLLDRANATAPGGVDPASGLPNVTPTPPAGVTLTEHTLTADEVPNGATLADIAKALKIDATELLAFNAATLDNEAQARGLAHSDNGRIVFAGTTLKVPTKGR